RGVDVILMLAEVPALGSDAAIAEWEPGPGAVEAVELLSQAHKPMILVLTKADLLGEQRMLLPIIAKWQAIRSFDAVVPVSALREAGLEALRTELEALLPEGPPLYDQEQLSDRSTRWHAAEL